MKWSAAYYISIRRGRPPCLPNKGNHRGLPLRSLVGLAVLCCNTALYAASLQDAINQSNSNADRIAAQSQANIIQQQQVLAQRLQALSAAMQAQNPDIPIVVQTVPTRVQPAPVAPPAVKVAPVVTTPTSPSQNNNGNSRNQWDYGF
jgi:hypothetical protein